MEYDDTFGERDRIMNNPTLAYFKERVRSKPNGDAMLESYIRQLGDLKYAESRFAEFGPDYPYYKELKADIERRRRIVGETEAMLDEPLTALEAFVGAPKITKGWWDKTVDVVKNRLENPEEDPEAKSSKPSLWDVFLR